MIILLNFLILLIIVVLYYFLQFFIIFLLLCDNFLELNFAIQALPILLNKNNLKFYIILIIIFIYLNISRNQNFL